MAKEFSDAYKSYLSWLTPNETESAAAVTHRASIDQAMKSHFGSCSIFRSGSFGFGTSVSGHSDVDYFAVIESNKLKKDSNSSLEEVKSVLKKRFPQTPIYVDSPAIALEFGKTDGERHEIIPAWLIEKVKDVRVYGIPDLNGGWMRSSPDAHAAYVDAWNKKYEGKLKPLIRIIKSWKYHRSVPIRSFYLEVAVTEYARTQQSISYEHDVSLFFYFLQKKALSPFVDPSGLSVGISPCGASDRALATIEINRASDLCQGAYTLRERRDMRSAFSKMDELFGGNFPAYY